jgi:hypothetical protein
MSFRDLEADAIAHLNNEGGEPAENTENNSQVSDDGQPDPSTLEQDSSSQVEAQGGKTPAEAQAIADLSKFKEVTINGQKMSIEDLQKSIMRQNDYTRKTQELAKQRQEVEKYESNIWADLEKVKRDPRLATEFKRLYPAKYHTALRFVQQGGDPQQAQAAQQGLPPELEERFNRYDQFINETTQEKVQAEQQALEANLQSFETNLLKKYPKADPIAAYTFAENAKARFEQENGRPMTAKDLNEKFMEPHFKASHDHQVKLFNQWQKEMAKQAQNTNRVASDTGRGGGTPGGAPSKMRLKDVADHILSGPTE